MSGRPEMRFLISERMHVFGQKIPLFKVFGFEVKVDTSWFFLLLLVIWSLSKGYFPGQIEDLNPTAYWAMGIMGAFGLFFSLIFHEMSHSMVARSMGLQIRGITLFIFGGVAELSEEPKDARTEFWVAIAGPIASGFLAGFFWVAEWFCIDQVLPLAVSGVFGYLWVVNLFLAGFNLLPGFPLDGGRIFRSILWAKKGDLRWATHWAAKGGSFIASMLMILGILGLFMGQVVAGIWWFLIALFLKSAAKSSETQLAVNESFKGEPISRFMVTDVKTVSPEISIPHFIENYVYKTYHKMFPVVDAGQLLGSISTREIKAIDSKDWASTTVRDIYLQCSDANSLPEDMDALQALKKMSHSSRTRYMIVDQANTLKGVVTLKDLLNFLSLRLDLEDEASGLRPI